MIKDDIRRTILLYHNQEKQKSDARAGFPPEPPPLLTVYDELKVEQQAIKVRSYADILFYRAAHRAALRAGNANVKAQAVNPSFRCVFVAEEMEAAAECITMSAMCLEAYINGFCQDCLPKIWSELERLDSDKKWLLVSRLLTQTDCFTRGSQPFQDFKKLIGWCNDELVHFKHDFEKPVLNQVMGIKTSYWYSICNAATCRFAMQTVEAMIRRLNTHLTYPAPSWLQT